jgi:hypothetical protein
MEGAELLLWMVLLILAVLAGAVLYLLASRRHYQRVDYSRLVEQEIERRHLAGRLDRLEQLIGDLAEYDKRRRRELDAFARETRNEMVERIRRAHDEIVSEVLTNPTRWDQLLLEKSGAQLPEPEPQLIAAAVPDANPQLMRFLRGPRQKQIAELLELGNPAAEVVRALGVSRHEVDLVSAIIFKTKSA